MFPSLTCSTIFYRSISIGSYMYMYIKSEQFKLYSLSSCTAWLSFLFQHPVLSFPCEFPHHLSPRLELVAGFCLTPHTYEVVQLHLLLQPSWTRAYLASTGPVWRKEGKNLSLYHTLYSKHFMLLEYTSIEFHGHKLLMLPDRQKLLQSDWPGRYTKSPLRPPTLSLTMHAFDQTGRSYVDR